MRINHTFPPIYDKNSRILILGSMPSVKSRESGFYYMHPRNRFWLLLGELLNDPVPTSINERILFLKKHQIALWDVISSCEIKGSSDSSIRNAKPNDIAFVLLQAPIRRVFTNGKTADKLYRTLAPNETLPAAVCLPSTSPANAQFQLPQLLTAWKVLLNDL